MHEHNQLLPRHHCDGILLYKCVYAAANEIKGDSNASDENDEGSNEATTIRTSLQWIGGLMKETRPKKNEKEVEIFVCSTVMKIA